MVASDAIAIRDTKKSKKRKSPSDDVNDTDINNKKKKSKKESKESKPFSSPVSEETVVTSVEEANDPSALPDPSDDAKLSEKAQNGELNICLITWKDNDSSFALL